MTTTRMMDGEYGRMGRFSGGWMEEDFHSVIRYTCLLLPGYYGVMGSRAWDALMAALDAFCSCIVVATSRRGLASI